MTIGRSNQTTVRARVDQLDQTTGAQVALDRESAFLRPFGVTSASRQQRNDDITDGRAMTLDDHPDREDI
jgi:hypothetical protein